MAHTNTLSSPSLVHSMTSGGSQGDLCVHGHSLGTHLQEKRHQQLNPKWARKSQCVTGFGPRTSRKRADENTAYSRPKLPSIHKERITHLNSWGKLKISVPLPVE